MELKDFEELALLAVEETHDVILVTDPLTYNIQYLNHAGLVQFDVDPADYLGKPCYRALRGLSAPCDYCPLDIIDHDAFYQWEYYNPKVDRYFTARGKLVSHRGRSMHLEIGNDITELRRSNMTLRGKLHMEETLVSCIQILAFANDMSAAVEHLLSQVGTYYGADRAYIFELDRDTGALQYTHQWCAPNIASNQAMMETLTLSDLKGWMEEFTLRGELTLNGPEDVPDKTSPLYRLFTACNVRALMAAPLLLDGQIIGFCGVDSPTDMRYGTELLRSVAVFIAADLGKRMLNRRIIQRSYVDALTNVGNRWAFLSALEDCKNQPPASLGMALADINGLKLTNDTKGQDYGDYLLRHTADTLCTVFGDQVYRVGGDEFVVLCPGLSRTEFEDRVRLLREVCRRDPDVDLSVGVSWSAGQDMDVTAMSERSDALMSQQKQEYHRARSEGNGGYRDNLVQALRRDLSLGKFCVYLQPKVSIDTGELLGAEALVRRMDTRGGLIPPVRFIPMFEAEGIIRDLDLFVLDTVCAAMRRWDDLGCAVPRVAVNCSRVTAKEPGLAERLLSVCQRYDLAPKRILIEITERIGTIGQEELTNLMTSLKQAGFSVSLDDFGAEYSNLAMLSSFGFDEVKLDKSLVDNLEHSAESRIIVSHVIAMCNELGHTPTVAEGVETEVQRELLRGFRCQGGQGYLFDRPMPLEIFAQKYIYTSGL